MADTGEKSAIPAPGGEQLPRKFGKYTLMRKLATGGMAELYLAIHRSISGFEKLIVIKQILPQFTADPEFVRMFMDEAKIAATLNHPNVIQIFDVGSIADRYFIAMEYIHGEDLRSIVKTMVGRGMREFPIEHALQIVGGICAALDYAHTKKGFENESLEIVHRDVSPQNVLVTFTGDVKLVDFGIAKAALKRRAEVVLAGGAGADPQQVEEGQLRGKFPYMSPEQCRGEPLDHRSDIFSLGIILFELTTGRRLFKGKSEVETIRKIVEQPYPEPTKVRPGYPAALEPIVLRALARDRDRRYASAREMQVDIERFVRDERVPTSSISLANFMHDLFGDRLAAQRQAMAEGKQLADVIAAEPEPGEIRFDDMADATGSGIGSTPRATRARPTGPMEVARRSRAGLWAGASVAVVAVAVAVVALFLATRGADETPAGLPPAPEAGDAIEPRSLPDVPAAAAEAAAAPTPVVAGVLLFTGVAPGMKVFLDGKFVFENRGVAPDDAPMPLTSAGDHVLRLDHPDYVADEIPLVLPEDGLAPAKSYGDGWIIDLGAAYVRPLAEGEVYVSLAIADEGAELRLNGEPAPYRPGERLRRRARLVDGSVKVEVTKRGYEEWRRFLRPDAGSPTEVSVSAPINLARAGGGPGPRQDAGGTAPPPGGTGTLRVRCDPWAAVSIQGRGTQNTPLSIELPAGSYTLRFSNSEQGLEGRTTVTIRPGETAKVTSCW